MTPKEKANELANKMYKGSPFDKTKEEHILECENAKRCALIAVDELIQDNEMSEILVSGGLQKQFWEEVKQKIEKL
jgi:hypothetical protein